MKMKRLMAMVLSLCLILSMLVPAVTAANTDSAPGAGQDGHKVTGSPFGSPYLATGKNPSPYKNLRNDPLSWNDLLSTGPMAGWSASPREDVQTNLSSSGVPKYMQELKKAAEHFKATDMVRVMVVMEAAPLSEQFDSISQVPAASEQKLIDTQNEVIATIEKSVLSGSKLEVRHQFTYLANAFSVNTQFGNLQQIAGMKGVKSISILPMYEPCETQEAGPLATSGGVMSGVPNVWDQLDYTGTGMRIAVLDTGLDLDHPSFAADPQTNGSSLTAGQIDEVLTKLNAYALRNGRLSADDLYRSVKVPYAFNYVDESLTADHTADMQGDHGTHVAGIAAANPVEGSGVVGMAPDAQIIVMKVFGAAGGAYTDDIVAALEDALLLDCDVINMSLGAANGFSSESEFVDAVYARIAEEDVIVAVAAGNDGPSSYGNLWGTDLSATEHPENGTVGSPGTYMNTTVVASADNLSVMFNSINVDGRTFLYNDALGLQVTMFSAYGGQELEYVLVPGLGAEEDFADIDVYGKIALIQRGSLNFSQKVANAEAYGAIGVIIYNNEAGSVMHTGIQLADEMGELPAGVDPTLPVVMISMEDGLHMAAAENKTLLVESQPSLYPDEEGGQMSVFSSWGTTSDLRLLPDITGVGGNVYSCYDEGQYGIMSGTSMATPQVAGISALVLQYIHDKYPGLTDAQIHTLADALLMSTAVPVISNVSGLEASPRQQGAGLVSAIGATTTSAYLTVNGGKPKAELGDGNGTYTFSFELHNMGAAAKTYGLDASLLTELAEDLDKDSYFMSGVETLLDGTVTFDCGDSVTVAPGETKTISVTVTVSETGKQWLEKYYPQGGFVEGFLHLTDADENGVDLVLPYMGFYGDWTQHDVFDSAFWYDNSFWSQESAKGDVDGDEFWHVMWTNAGSDWVLGFNPYTDAEIDENGNVVYDPANNILSPNGDGAMDGFVEMYISLMRNAKTMTLTYTVDGNVVHEEKFDNVRKTMYNANYGQVIPFVYSWYGSDPYDFAGLANETKVLLTISATVDYGDGGEHAIQIPITIDLEAPTLHSITQETVDGKCYLHITAAENLNLADVFVLNAAGTRVLAEQSEFTYADGLYSATIDVTGLGTQFVLALCDYGCNETFYDVEYTEGGDNRPAMDTSKLYAYRINDEILNNDTMYGWVSMDKNDPLINIHTSDYMETYSVVAAEYAGGLIFAADAGDNLCYVVPGLWDRHFICNLGMTVIDMAFDHTNGLMYALVKDDFENCILATIDLITGEITPVADFGYYYYAPWTLAITDDGTFYSVIQGDSSLYTIGWDADGMGMTTPVEGVTLTDSYGNPAEPSYSQSMAYSAEDNKLYWAYFSSSWMGSVADLITIDLTDFSCTAVPFHGIYNDGTNEYDLQSAQELVGLMVLEEDGYQFPVAETLESIVLDQEVMILQAGQSYKLSVLPTPWNYDLQDVTWESSDPGVVTVENGQIVGIAKGSATVTAVTEGHSASCLVTVAEVSGGFYAYDYYNATGVYGDLMYVDMGAMNSVSLADSPVDFVAGDYVAHVGEQGSIFGYNAAGQFYRLDMATGEALAIGNGIGSAPADMAYDYTTGALYAVYLDMTTYECYLCMVNLNDGQLHPVAVTYDMLMTLACDAEGRLFSMTADGNLVELVVADGWMDTVLIIPEIMYLSYAQSMCYDHTNNVLLWANTETGNVFWMDPYAENPYVIALGDPTHSGSFQMACMFTEPLTVPELPYVALEDATANDLFMLVGTTKQPEVTAQPLNATNQSGAWVSSDPSVVQVNADGTLTALAEGMVTISGTITDGENTVELSFQVKSVKGSEKLYGHLLSDLATSGGQYWVRLYPDLPGEPASITGLRYTLYAEEYYNGKLYAYGYDPNDFEANWQFMVIDPKTFRIEAMTDMGEGCPFVYDMTYSYDLGIMFCVAGPGFESSDIYIVDMKTGKLTPYMETDEFFMSLAAGPDGILYAMENSAMDYDTWDYSNAKLYTVEPVTKTITLVGDTGIRSNKLASMVYDYDSGYLYWPALFQADFFSPYVGSFRMVDPATGDSYNLGVIGEAGAQMSGLYILGDNKPQESVNELHAMMVEPNQISVYLGEEPQALSIITLPLDLEGIRYTFTSSDPTVASVDENGMITGNKLGVVTVTVTAVHNGKTITSQCQVQVLPGDAAYLTYNLTDGGWALISHKDPTVVTNLNEGEDLPKVEAIASCGEQLYGIDADNNLFLLNTETFERTVIANVTPEINTDEGLVFSVADMEYDKANGRMLVLGCIRQQYVDWYGDIADTEIENGRRIYELDLETGEMTELLNLYELGYYSYVTAMTVDAGGTVYFYSTFDDGITRLDMNTGSTTTIVTLQSQSIMGDEYCDYAMYYDATINKIKLLFTSNGEVFRMLNLDPALGTLTLVDYVGDVVFDEYMWEYYGAKAYVGLTMLHSHAPADPAAVTFQWSEDHSSCILSYECSCGQKVDLPCEVLTQTDPAECTEDGKVTYTATLVVNGETYTDVYEEVLEHTGHAYESEVTPPTTESQGYTTHTCTNCGDSYVDSYTGPLDPDNSETGEHLNLPVLAVLTLTSGTAVLILLKRKEQF